MSQVVKISKTKTGIANKTKVFIVFALVSLSIVSVFLGWWDANNKSVKTAMAQDTTINLFVATDGNDAWSGRYCSPNLEKTDGPLATPEGARNKIRELKNNNQFTKPINVYFRGGTYYLSKTFVLTPEDSGTSDKPITYQSYPGEKAIISGGKPITTNWTAYQNGIYKTNVGTGWQFNSLFVNGKRAVRARAPNIDSATPYYLMADVPVSYEGVCAELAWGLVTTNYCSSKYAACPQCTGFKYSGSEFSNWTNLQDVEVSVFTQWENPRVKLQSVDTANKTVRFSNYPAHAYSLDYNYVCDNNAKPFPCTGISDKRTARYYIENALELLDSPGEWYLNKQTGDFYYMPLAGENINTAEVISPNLATIISIDGNTAAVASYINFKGLGVYHTDWSFISPYFTDNATLWILKTQPAINFDRAENCAVEDNTVAHTGKHGINIAVRARNIKVIGNEIYDTGATALKIGRNIFVGETESIQIPNGGNTVSDNKIHDFATIFYSQVGILMAEGDNNTVSHNVVYDGPGMGIFTGIWPDFGTNWGNNNIIEYNEVYNVMKGMNDGAAIYNAGYRPGTKIRHNVVHDILLTRFHLHNSRIWGIYLDAGSQGIEVSNNLVYRSQTGSLFLHRNVGNVITNNIFVDGISKNQIWVVGDLWQSIMPHDNEITCNIVYYTGGAKLFSTDLSDLPPSRSFTSSSSSFKNSDYNLFWNPDLSIRTNTSLWNIDEWRQVYGFDKNSLVTDPLFKNYSSTADYKKGNFDLLPNSPAFSLGFKSIDFSQVGPRFRPQPQSIICPVAPSADTVPPTRSNGQPTGILLAGTTHTTISLTTNEKATCKYSTAADTSYDSMANTFSTTGATFHSTTITELTSGASCNFYIKCKDTAGNQNIDNYTISFSTALIQPEIDTIVPSSINSLTTSDITQNSVKLSWIAPGDDGNIGTAQSYDIRYYTASITEANWSTVSGATGEPVPQISGTSQAHIITGLSPDTTYYFAIKAKDEANNSSGISNVVSAKTQSATLFVTLTASPNTGQAPLNGVDLTAVVAGTVTGLINYTFYCDRSDSGTNVTTSYSAKRDNSSQSAETISDACNYTSPGTYYAKVIVERNSMITQQTVLITVTAQQIFLTGVLIKLSTSPTVYVVEDNQIKPIPSLEVFMAKSYNASSIQTIDSSTFSQYQIGSPVTATLTEIHRAAPLYKSDIRDEVYALIYGKLHWIPSMSVFNDYQYNVQNIKIITQGEIDKYPKAKLIKAQGDDRVYYLTSRYQKRWIKSSQIFDSYGFSWSDILEVLADELNIYNDNILVKTAYDPQVYLLINNTTFRPIQSAQEFLSFNYLWEDIAIISQAEFGAYSLR